MRVAAIRLPSRKVLCVKVLTLSLSLRGGSESAQKMTRYYRELITVDTCDLFDGSSAIGVQANRNSTIGRLYCKERRLLVCSWRR